MQKKIKFIEKDSPQKAFYATLKKRVDDYFNQKKISRKGNIEMGLKTIFFLGGSITLYLLLLLGNFNSWIMLCLAILLGAFKAFVGFNVCHDAIHGSYSKYNFVNNLMSYSFYLIGANVYVWKLSHNTAHHMYTNISGHDEDIAFAPGLVRLTEGDRLYKIMRYQHLYAFALYSLVSLVWVFKKDYVRFFQNSIGNCDNSKRHLSLYIKLFFFKMMYYTLFIVLPLIMLDISWWQFLLGFLTMHFVMGWVLGMVFQLAHLVEDTQFPLPNQDGNLEEAWAVHQMHTTANFSCDSRIVNLLCGGLNFQIEHHLFPQICHVHYRNISKLVRKTAEEHHIPYIENPTFLGALKSHYRFLRKYGVEALNKA